MKGKKHIIACRAFQDALSFLNVETRFPTVKLHYLPASLHINPLELKARLLSKILQLSKKKHIACCLYGQCFPDIDEVLKEKGITRIPCRHCYETLLGSEHYKKIIEDRPGSFFLEKELLMNFDEYCWKPLEFDDPQMRQWYFEHYQQIIYIKQPRDPDLIHQAKKIADSLKLSLRVIEADYHEFDFTLTEILQNI